MEATEEYKQAGLIMMISGGLKFLTLPFCIIPVFWILGWVTIVPGVAIGVWQIMTGMKAKNGEAVPNLKTVNIVGIVGACLCFNIFSLGASIFNLINIGKPEVAGYLESIAPAPDAAE